jgi:hypothetical protein
VDVEARNDTSGQHAGVRVPGPGRRRNQMPVVACNWEQRFERIREHLVSSVASVFQVDSVWRAFPSIEGRSERTYVRCYQWRKARWEAAVGGVVITVLFHLLTRSCMWGEVNRGFRIRDCANKPLA